MSAASGDEPSLLKVMYDSLTEIKGAVAGVAEKQNQLSTQVALAMAKNEETARAQAASSTRIDEVETEVGKLSDTVGDLKRTAWLLTVVGGIIVAVATTVVGDWASAAFNTREPKEQNTTTITNTQPK